MDRTNRDLEHMVDPLEATAKSKQLNEDVKVVFSSHHMETQPEAETPLLLPNEDPEYKLLLEIHDHMTNKKQSRVLSKRPS